MAYGEDTSFFHETPPKIIKHAQKRGVLQTATRPKASGDSRLHIFMVGCFNSFQSLCIPRKGDLLLLTSGSVDWVKSVEN